MSDVRALVLACSLKRSPASSSSELLGRQVLDALAAHGVKGDVARVADHDVRFGVSTDEGDGDAWSHIREQILAADLDAELSETDAQGRPSMYGKVAAVAVVGNEDGAHHVTAEVFQALNDVGFTLAAAASTYWVGEAMGRTDYQAAGPKPDTTGKATRALAANAAHLAGLLRKDAYPMG